MKLLFLYIEKSRKFRNQSFNFDSNERFHYTAKTLTYEKLDVLPHGFFDVDNVGNDLDLSVSAIVGENGSGKTSMAYILDLIFSDYRSVPFKFVCVYSIDGIYYCIENIGGLQLSDNLKAMHSCGKLILAHADSEVDAGELKLPRLVYISPMFILQGRMFNRNPYSDKPSTTIDLSTTAICEGAVLKKAYSEEYRKMLGVVHDLAVMTLGDKNNKIPLPCPNTITISCPRSFPNRVSNCLMANFISEGNSLEHDWYANSVRAFDYAHIPDIVLRLISVLQDENITTYAANRFDLGDCSPNNRWIDFGLDLCRLVDSNLYACEPDELEETDLRTANQIVESWNKFDSPKQNEVRHKAIELLKEYFGDEPTYAECVSVLERVNKFLYEDDGCDLHIVSTDEDELCESDDVITADFSVISEEESRLVYDILARFVKSNEAITISFGNMSSGELSFLSMMGRIRYMEENDDGEDVANENIVVLLDEAETTLHPEWQRKLVYCMLRFFGTFMSEYNAHLVFASHSPLILSDIPIGNVCFLGDNSEAPKHTNTFGANIFDLYRSSFFLREGPMGAFAADKIDKLLGKLKDARQNGGSATIEEKSPDGMLAKLVGDPFIGKYLRSCIS